MLIVLAMAVCVGWTPDGDAAELVARLGSPRFAEREEAAVALKRLGPRALPALRRARSAADLEIRLRAAKVRDEIESATILEPTLVRLDFRDRPLSEVIGAIDRRSGMALAPSAERSIRRPGQKPAGWPDRRITLEAPDPLPFWEAIDRLGRAGGLRRLHHSVFHMPDEPFGRLDLEEGAASPPRSDHGPFRVELLRIHRERDLDLAPGLSAFGFVREGRGPFSPGGPGPEVKQVRVSTFSAELLVSVEPRLRIIGLGVPERLKAVDGEGRSLLREPTAKERDAQATLFRNNPHLDPALHPEMRFGWGGMQSAITQVRSIALADSTPPGTRLARLEGVIVAAVMARRADLVVVSLDDPRERTVEGDGIRLTIHEVEVKPSHFDGEVEITLETETPGETIKVQGPGVAPVEIRRPFDLLQRQIEIVDALDRPMGWAFRRPPSRGASGRMRLLVRSPEPGRRVELAGLRLRVFAMVGAAVEVPFAFTDIPMP